MGMALVNIYETHDNLLDEDTLFFNFDSLQKFAQHWCNELNKRNADDYKFYQHKVDTEQEIQEVLALNHIELNIGKIEESDLELLKNDMWY